MTEELCSEVQRARENKEWKREFAEYFEIPYRTMQDWELGNREMPAYLLRLNAYKVEMEKLVKQ